MLKNFLKLTFRNLLKNKTYVIINILGLGLSLACCIVAYINYDYGTSYDHQHENIDKIFKIQISKKIEDNNIRYGITPTGLGYAMNDKSSAISKQSRYGAMGISVLKENRAINKFFGFVDNDFLDMFTFPLKYGDKSAIHQKGFAIISTELSEILFGEGVNPVGELMKIAREDGQITFTVGGVLEKIPDNASMHFQGILNYDHYLDFQKIEALNWKRFTAGTFIMMDDPTRSQEVIQMLQEFIPIQNSARTDWKISSFYLEPLRTMAYTARDIRLNWGIWSAPHPMAIIVPPVMAILMLLVACFNFTNTSIAISNRRLKEIGVRKVMGSSRKQLIFQFMGENLMLTFISLLLGILIATWLVPAYSAMWEGLTLRFNLLEDFQLLLFLFILLAFTAILAGAYPSLYISKFDSVTILKGNTKTGKTHWLSYGLLTVQYTLTIIALIASVAFARNALYQQNQDLGFNKDSIVYVEFNKSEEGTALKNAISRQSYVKSAVLSNQHVGDWTYSRTLKNQDKEVSVDIMGLGQGYIETMDLSIIEGRSFDKRNEESDYLNSIIVNEKLVKSFGWENPIGQRVSIGDTIRLNVVGVVKDFYNSGFWQEIEPIAFRLTKEATAGYLIVKANNGDLKTAMTEMENAWEGISPNTPFDGQYQDELLSDSLDVNRNIVIIFSFLGILSVILSAIGMFTLVSLNIIRRVKEIGVRKVLGARIPNIILLLNKVFIIVLVVATLLGSIAAIFLINGLMGSIYAYYQAIDLLTIMMPIAIVFGISFIISSLRIFSTAQKNPVESLRYE